MEERGHLGKKYDSESQEPSSDLWGRIEPRIERKRRPFGLLWWFGLGGTMLLLVGLWKVGTERTVLPTAEPKTIVQTQPKAKNEHPIEAKQEMAQNALTMKESPKRELTPSIKSNQPKAGKQMAKESNSSQPFLSEAKPESKEGSRETTTPRSHTKTVEKRTIEVEHTSPVLPLLVKTEKGKPTVESPVSLPALEEKKEQSPALVAKTEVQNAPVTAIELQEKQAEAEPTKPIQNETLKSTSNATSEQAEQPENSPAFPPFFNSTVESPAMDAAGLQEKNQQNATDANSLAQNSFHPDTLKKVLPIDSLTAHLPDSVPSDSSKTATKRTLKLGFAVASFYTTKSLSINQNPEEHRVRITNKNAITSDRFAWSASLWFQKSVNSYLNWYASVGVLFLQDRTDFSVQNDSILRFSERFDANGNRFLRPVYGEWAKSVKSQKLYFEVQTGLSLLNLFGPVGFKIGPGINYLLWDDRRITGVLANAEPAIASGTKILPSLHLGIPLSWNFAGGQSLLMEPSATYFFSPAFHPHTGTDITPTLAGLKIGFSW